ncbi:MAG: riboflavin synthase [Planctomycetota bacterium]|nr:riboflavin synthase [Planctomycetota bacterium]
MFTGIVQALARVASIEHVDFGAVLTIDPGDWPHRPQEGESIAVNGCCLTVTAPGPHTPADMFRFDVIRQTLRLTNLGDLTEGSSVNLELAVTADQMLSGHIVQGHIDGVGVVREVQRDENEWRIRIDPPEELRDYIIDKGSVALDGVSMTVAGLDDRGFEVALIPTTLQITTLGRAEAGTRLNIETDYIAKTVVHWLKRQETASMATR